MTDMTAPETQVGRPMTVWAESETVLAWFIFPLPKLEMTPQKAKKIAILVKDAVLHGQSTFGVLEGHAKKCGHPHPKERSRSAVVNGRSHPGDVSDPDGGGESGGQGLEVRDVALVTGVIVLTRNNPKAMTEGPDLNDGQT
jgi:hypothetical protein